LLLSRELIDLSQLVSRNPDLFDATQNRHFIWI